MAVTTYTPVGGGESANWNGNAYTNTYDGNTATDWIAPDSGRFHWVYLDLGSAKAISKVRVFSEDTNEAWALCVSDDLFDWEVLADDVVHSVSGWNEYEFHPVTARYVMVKKALAGNDWPSLGEIEVQYDDDTANHVAYTPGTRRHFLSTGPSLGNKTHTASTTYDIRVANLAGELAYQNSTGTSPPRHWLSNGAADGEWWKVDFGELKPVSDIRFFTNNSVDVGFTIETSVDDASWSAFDSEILGPNGYADATDTERDVRYIRFTGRNVSAGNWMMLGFVEASYDGEIVQYGVGGDWRHSSPGKILDSGPIIITGGN